MGYRTIFATSNEGRIREIHLVLTDLGLPVLSTREAGTRSEIAKDGTTFGENVEIKARAVWSLTGGIVLMGDPGLEMGYIGGEPGIYSARYSDEDTSYEVKNRSIIERLKEATGQERGAKFMCSIAAILPNGRVFHTGAVMEGLAAGEPAGDGGLGYNSILYPPQFGKTSAEIIMEQKNEISHGGKALRVMKGALEGVPR